MTYTGSKDNVAKKLHSMAPEHVNFVDVFTGSGAMLLHHTKRDGMEVMNDIYADVTNFYEQVILNPERIIAAASLFINSRYIWRKWLDELEDNKSLEDILSNLTIRAVKFLYVNTNSFNGNMSSFSPGHSRYYNNLLVKKLFTLTKRLRSAIIENLDFEELISKYNRYDNTFFYLDPPYIVAEKHKIYNYNFTNDDHIRLAKCCKEIDKRGNTFLLSYDDEELIRNLYQSFDISTMNFVYTASKGESKKQRELIVTNYRKVEQLSLL